MADTTLAAAQSGDGADPGYNLVYADDAGPRAQGFIIRIDDEFEFVEWRGDQTARPWQVVRGYLGSDPASHADNATVLVEPVLGAGVDGEDGADGEDGIDGSPGLPRVAAGVPTGAPTAGEVGVALDTTAVSGGIYLWTGAAWVKGADIP